MDTFYCFNPNCTLPDTVPIGFVNAPNIRATMQIIWSCFSVILLCTWSILRPNVPPELRPKEPRPADPIYKKLFPKQKIYKTLFSFSRKVYWAGVMLIAPEFLTTFTTKKMLGTKENNALLKTLAGSDMRGIVIEFSNIEGQIISNKKYGLVKYAQENDQVVDEALMPSQQGFIPSGDIESDHLCPEGGFITQFERRQSRWFGVCEFPWKRHEPHVRTAIKVKEALKDKPYWKIQTIAALSGSLWTLDSMQLADAIKHGIIAGLPDTKTAGINEKNKSEALIKVLAVIQVIWMAAASSVSEEAFEAIANAAPFLYMQFPLVQYRHYFIPSVAFHETAGDLKVIDTKSLIVAMITVVSFGGIYLLGLLWKIFTIMTIACPALYGSKMFVIKTIIGFVNFFYFFARLFLITKSIRSLYYLPQDAYTATWTADFSPLS
ncbi:hypothetical protein J3E69DRAFT_353909 [Trichoderma sp. SZMC 28015]